MFWNQSIISRRVPCCGFLFLRFGVSIEATLPVFFWKNKETTNPPCPFQLSGVGCDSGNILGKKHDNVFFLYSNDNTLLYFGLIRVFSLIKLISEVSVQQSEQRVRRKKIIMLPVTTTITQSMKSKNELFRAIKVAASKIIVVVLFSQFSDFNILITIFRPLFSGLNFLFLSYSVDEGYLITLRDGSI